MVIQTIHRRTSLTLTTTTITMKGLKIMRFLSKKVYKIAKFLESGTIRISSKDSRHLNIPNPNSETTISLKEQTTSSNFKTQNGTNSLMINNTNNSHQQLITTWTRAIIILWDTITIQIKKTTTALSNKFLYSII